MTDHRLIARVTEDLWACAYCGACGSQDDILTSKCTHNYTPCKSCGSENACAPMCVYSPNYHPIMQYISSRTVNKS